MGYSCKIYALMVQIKKIEAICLKNDRARPIFVKSGWNFLIFEVSQISRIFMVFGSRFKIPAMGPIFGPDA